MLDQLVRLGRRDPDSIIISRYVLLSIISILLSSILLYDSIYDSLMLVTSKLIPYIEKELFWPTEPVGYSKRISNCLVIALNSAL